MFCANCGSLIIEGSKFCPKCGHDAEGIPRTTANLSGVKPTKENGVKKVIGGIGGVAGFVIAYLVVRALFNLGGTPTQSKADLIGSTVKQIKTTMSLPNKLDEVTTLTDITAETGAIRYHYILSGADTSKLSNDYFRSFLKPKICSNSDTKSLLNQDINMEYSYIVQETAQSYFTAFTKTDCN